MGLATFKDGVRPYGGKELSANKSTKILIPKGELVYPLSQHIGAPAKPLVKKDDQVLMGQTIGGTCGFVSASIICSISGTVKTVEPRRVTNGSMAESIVVENNGEYKTVERMGADRNPSGLSKQEIRGIVKETGIVGLGGMGFPTHVKLTSKEDNKIEYVIANGAKCEPYLTPGYRPMLEQLGKTIGGLNIILSLFDKAQSVIGIEDNKPEAIAKMTELMRNESRIRVIPLKTKYPQGGERTFTYAVTGRRVNPTMLPADMGCIVDNMDAISATYMTVCYRTPLLRRIFTVTGDAVASPGNFEVCIGTCQQKLVGVVGNSKTEPEKIISGGPMMGQALFDLNIPVMKTSSILACIAEDEVAAQKPTACIRCSKCAEVHPGRIILQKLMRPALNGDLETFEELHGMEYCECGCCAFICLARKQLTQAFKEAKLAARAAKKKVQESEE